MEVLVDTSVWIDYFRSGEHSGQLSYLIDENLVLTNDLILAELVPLLKLKNEGQVISLLQSVKNNPMRVDWEELVDLQVLCLKAGSNGIGVPDLLIAQNAIQHNVPVYSIDKHFRFMYEANFGLRAYFS